MPANTTKARKISVKRVRPIAKNTDTMPTNDNPAADPRTMLSVINGAVTVTPDNTDFGNTSFGPERLPVTSEALINAASMPDITIEQTAALVTAAHVALDSEHASDDTQADLSERHLARLAAKAAVSAFYSGSSMPFKAACDLKYRAAVHPRGAAQTARTAGLIAAIITYCDINPDYTFKRGSGAVPGRLLGYTGADASRIFAAGPESGALGRLLGDARITHVSGTLHGNGAESATFKIDPTKCRANLVTFNNKLDNGSRVFSAPLRLLRVLEKANDAHLAAVPSEPTSPDITNTDIGI